MVNGGLGLILVMRGCIHSRSFFPSAPLPVCPSAPLPLRLGPLLPFACVLIGGDNASRL